MNRAYKFVPDPAIALHGWLTVSIDGVSVATKEVWNTVDEKDIKRMMAHECKPGQMIPGGDPRWNSHCQWCGEEIDHAQGSAYYMGQYHRECYRNVRQMTKSEVFQRSHD